METQISKAQTDVWKLKELVYNKIKKIPKDKRIKFIIDDTKETIENLLKDKELIRN